MLILESCHRKFSNFFSGTFKFQFNTYPKRTFKKAFKKHFKKNFQKVLQFSKFIQINKVTIN